MLSGPRTDEPSVLISEAKGDLPEIIGKMKQGEGRRCAGGREGEPREQYQEESKGKHERSK